MRTKALLLGAKALPLEGSWVSIEEAERWSCRVEGFPSGNARDFVDLEVLLHTGETAVFSSIAEFCGKAVRVLLREGCDVEIISVYVEAFD